MDLQSDNNNRADTPGIGEVDADDRQTMPDDRRQQQRDGGDDGGGGELFAAEAAAAAEPEHSFLPAEEGEEEEVEEEVDAGGCYNANNGNNADDSMLQMMMADGSDDDDDEGGVGGNHRTTSTLLCINDVSSGSQTFPFSLTAKKEVAKNLDSQYFSSSACSNNSNNINANNSNNNANNANIGVVVSEKINHFEELSSLSSSAKAPAAARGSGIANNNNNNNNNVAHQGLHHRRTTATAGAGAGGGGDHHLNPIVPSTSGFAVALRIRPTDGGNGIGDKGSIHPHHFQHHPHAPPNPRGGVTNTIEIVNDSTVQTTGATVRRQFTYGRVLGPETDQAQVYRTTTAPLVERLFPNGPGGGSPGQSALCLVYGNTNGGKTHTLTGKVASSSASVAGGGAAASASDPPSSSEWGLLPRALSDVLARIRANNCSGTTTTMQLHLSFLEIYKEQVYDLLPAATAASASGTARQAPSFLHHPHSHHQHLKVREYHGEAVVQGLSKHGVDDLQHGLALIQQAQRNRRTATNSLNANSSRSHSIYQLTVVTTATTSTEKAAVPAAAAEKEAGATTTANDSHHAGDGGGDAAAASGEAVPPAAEITSTNFWFVDLAGSERTKRTGVVAGSSRQQEAAMINKSLMTLRACLLHLQDGSGGTANLPPVSHHRNSKLTHLLMRHLLKDNNPSQTVMIACVHPSAADYDETQHVLAYAALANSTVRMPVAGSIAAASRNGGGGAGRNKRLPQYDENGRRIKPAKSNRDNGKRSKAGPTSVRRKVSKMLQKLSPKRLGRNNNKRKQLQDAAAAEGCEVAFDEVGRAGDAAKPDDASAPKNSTKRMKTATDPATATATATAASDGVALLQKRLERKTTECMALQTKQSIQEGKIEDLHAQLIKEQSRVQDLQSKLENQEFAIREECSLMMESQLEMQRRYYESRIENMKTSSQDGTKIEELSLELRDRDTEILRMKKQHEAELKSALDELKSTQCELQATKERLERSDRIKEELIASNEVLARGDDYDDDDEEEEDDSDSSSTSSNMESEDEEVSHMEEEEEGDDDDDDQEKGTPRKDNHAEEEEEEEAATAGDGNHDDDTVATAEKKSARSSTVMAESEAEEEDDDEAVVTTEKKPPRRSTGDVNGDNDAEATEDEVDVEEEDIVTTEKKPARTSICAAKGEGDSSIEAASLSPRLTDSSVAKGSSESLPQAPLEDDGLEAKGDDLDGSSGDGEDGTTPSKSMDCGSAKKRPPLSGVSMNTNSNKRESTTSDESDDSFGPDQWIPPTKPPKQDAKGMFQRPRGRAPKGAEAWDQRKGLWRKSMAP